MGQTLAGKIIREHLVSGEMRVGEEIAIRIDQTLTQDATGTMAYLQLEAMGTEQVKTELSVAYIDHNTLQAGFENADDHRYIRTVAARHGVRFSRPGNGICHQVHLERFGVPGKTLIGSDSHTPTAGGLCTLGMGAGGLDVAVAMGGGAYYITMPRIIGVHLTGQLRPWVGAKDIILEVLRRLGVKGGVGAILEYYGPGVETLSVPQRATITNMGAELGATSSLFPSDERTREFLMREGREGAYRAIQPDADAVYDETVTIDLSSLVPLAACPHSPDNVRPVSELAGMPIDQVCIGSCTNSSMQDMLAVAAILRGRTVAPNVSLSVSPGSRQVYAMLAKTGALADLIAAGARILECACGPCIGMGFSPNSGGISLRTFNRNFEARSGTKDARVYLVSPEVAAVSAVRGVFTDPMTCGRAPEVTLPATFDLNDNLIDLPAPPEAAASVEVLRGPNGRRRPGRNTRGAARAQGRGQHHNGSHHARRGEDPAVPLQRPEARGILLHGLRSDVPGARETRRRGRHRRRRELRAGLLAGARRPRPALSRHPGSGRQELRPHPCSQPHQFRHRAADPRRPR